jgi:tetratricopeptide (TPR) repeat protein
MRRTTVLTAFLVATVVAGSGPTSSQTKSAGVGVTTGTGNEACASCHSEIYKSYSRTAMAKASGRAADGLITGEFLHKESGVHYGVHEKDGRVWMSYDREGSNGLHGERELLYFIGSGKKGRSYLFSEQGYLFETPINWYTQEGKWNMAPAYTAAREIPMNLPSFSSCLNCHTSGLQARIPGTRNRFSGEPFLHGGITCVRCHGENEGHLSGDGAMVNPAKLSAERRDSICMECHFEGTAAVEQPNKRLYQFQPGDKLSDFVHYFLLSEEKQAQTGRAVSQFEALSLSVCKRKAGDKMWCGSCHDPHFDPSAEEKVSYYRGKCLACHGEAFGAKHHANKPDCTACHMPSLPSQDVAHTESTDHRILRYPSGDQLQDVPAQHGLTGSRLEFFPESEAALADNRDFALAWQTLAHRNVPGAAREAEEYLRRAVKERPEDFGLLSALAFVEQEKGHEKDARELYERALKLKPRSNTVAANLGTLEAKSGNLRRAVELWQGAFARVPYQSAIGMNLAMAFCAAGQKAEARKYVARVLEFNPDFTKAKTLMGHLNADPVQCKP